MERLNIDHVGPYNVDDKGNQFILVIIDTFTKWIELFPVKDVEAKTTAEALIQHLGRYGCPLQILSDNGSSFVNKIIKELNLLLGLEWINTIAYSKEENSIVERANKEVVRHLRMICNHHKVRGQWSTFVPFVQRIFNASEKQSLGTSPDRLLFGNAVRLDANILQFPRSTNVEGEKIQSLSEWAANLLKIQNTAIEVAKATMLKAELERFAKELPRDITTFKVGDLVLLHYPTDSPAPKLWPVHQGPVEIINVIGQRYTVRSLVDRSTKDVHITRLSPFTYDKARIDPAEVARADEQEWLVDHIVDHIGDPKNKTEMRFLVKWKDLSDDYNSWEPWKLADGSGVRDNAQLHVYLRNRGLQRLIPKTQRLPRIED